MNNLITVVTRFQLPPGLTADQIRTAFEQAAPKFRNIPDLVRKQFLYSKDCRTAGGVYLWNDERAARTFMNEHVAPMIRFPCNRGELNPKPPLPVSWQSHRIVLHGRAEPPAHIPLPTWNLELGT